MRAPPTLSGAVIGYALPLAMVAPALFWGNLPQVLRDDATSLLLPAFVLLMVPGAFLGYFAGRRYHDGRSSWRFNGGLFIGGSVAASLLLWAGSVDVPLARRLVMAIFGGPFLAGFWLWLGALLGAAAAFGRRRPNEVPEQSGSDAHAHYGNK